MTALLALLRALVALVPLVGPYLVGRAQARQKAKIEGLEADKAANERMSHADISSGVVGSGLALAGYADYDVAACFAGASCMFDLHPVDLSNAVGAVGAIFGVVSSALASLALWRGWGKK